MIERSELSADESAQSPRDLAAQRALRYHRIKLAAQRYWWIAALTIMIGVGVQAYLCYTQPPRYLSFSRMMLGGHVSLPQQQVYNEVSDGTSFYGTQVALMKSPETLTQARERVGTLYPDVPADPLAQIDAGVEPRTSIFDLKVVSTNADYARLLLDAVMDTYLASKRGRKNQTTDEAASAITEEVSHLDAQIRTDEQQLLDFQKQNNVVFIEEQSASSANYLVYLNNELAQLIKEHGLLSLESKDPLINPEDYSVKTNSTNIAPGSTTLSDSYTRDTAAILAEQDYIEKLKILRDEYGVYLKDMHPKMVNLTDAINKEQKFLDLLKTRNVATRDAHREDLELQIKNLQTQITVWNTKSLELSDRLATYQELKNKVTREQTLYNQLASSIQAVDMNKSLDQDFVVIMEAASKAKPLDPNYPLQLAYGLLAGLAVGLAIIYPLARRDNKINSPLELEDAIPFPIMGQIPLVAADKKTKRVQLLSEDDSRYEYLEQFRYVRSALLFHSGNAQPPRSFMVSSAIPGEGKSTLAANLATVFAQTGLRTLLIDADLRKGVQHDIFNQPVGPGLADYLQGETGWHDILRATSLPNLHLITRGKSPKRSGDLFLTSITDQLIQETGAAYDIILWDSAPILAANDSSNLSTKLEGVLFVARIRHSTVDAVRTALNDLSQKHAHIFGIVLNGVEPNQPGYFHRYQYSEYYSAAV